MLYEFALQLFYLAAFLPGLLHLVGVGLRRETVVFASELAAGLNLLHEFYTKSTVERDANYSLDRVANRSKSREIVSPFLCHDLFTMQWISVFVNVV